MGDKQNQLIMDYKNTFGSEAGRRVLADLERKTGYYEARLPTDSNGIIDPLKVVSNVSVRSVIVEIKKNIDANLDEERQEKALAEQAADIDRE